VNEKTEVVASGISPTGEICEVKIQKEKKERFNS
jgi:hypothetical protein